MAGSDTICAVGDEGTGTNQLRIIDVTDPTNPSVLGGSSLSLPTGNSGCFRSGNLLYMVFSETSSDHGFAIIDVTDPASPVRLDTGTLTGLGSSPSRVVVVGTKAYISCNNPGASNVLRIVDVSNPAAPVVIGGSALSGLLLDYMQGMVVSGNYAYCLFYGNDNTANELFRIIDISNPALPTVVSGESVTGLPDFTSPGQPTLSGGLLYCPLYNFGGAFGESAADGLRIINVSNPSSPVVVGIGPSDLPANLQAMCLGGTHLYTAHDNGEVSDIPGKVFRVIDVSDPTTPTIVGGASITGLPTSAEAIQVHGNYVYLACWGGTGTPGFRVIDVSDPTTPVVVGGVGMTGLMTRVAYFSQFDSGGVHQSPWPNDASGFLAAVHDKWLGNGPRRYLG